MEIGVEMEGASKLGWGRVKGGKGSGMSGFGGREMGKVVGVGRGNLI